MSNFNITINRNHLFVITSVLAAIIMPLLVINFIPNPDIFIKKVNFLNAMGLLAATVTLGIYILNLLAIPAEKSIYNNDYGYTYKAQQLAKERSIPETLAHEILVKKWMIHWIAIPAILTIIMGTSNWLVAGYFIYPVLLGLKELYMEVKVRLADLNDNINNLKDK